MTSERMKLLDILYNGGYDFTFHEDRLSFNDKRIEDLAKSYVNYELFKAVRADKSLRILDLSKAPVVPEVLSDFLYIEEIWMPSVMYH